MQSQRASPVGLIIPPSLFLLDDRVFMNLGILKIAAVLEQAGIAVEMLDCSGIENYKELVGFYAKNSSANHFGITATTPQMPAATKVRDVIRAARPDAKIVLGGPHITLVHAAYRREKKLGINGRACRAMRQLEDNFDVLVAGDGEVAIFTALDPNAPKCIDADDLKSPLFLNNAQLTLLPFPARHLLEVESYQYYIDGERALSLIAQLGCPFACGFCGGRQSPFLRRIRMRTSENVVEELLYLYRTYGAKGFMFYDDELNVNRQMVELMRLITKAQRDAGVLWRLRGFIKAELFTDEQAAAMYEAGFRWILIGFESGSPKILENINKKATRDENSRAMEIAHRHGLKVKALMSVGHPGESFETITETHDWLLASRPEDFDVTIITTYAGTPYYDFAVPYGKLGDQNVWLYTHEKTGDRLYSFEIDYMKVSDYYKGIPGEYRSYVWTDYLTCENLIRLRDNLEANVREKLCIPFNSSRPTLHFEHSMGQMGSLPDYILKKTIL